MKTNLDSLFKTNSEDEKNGKWFELKNDDGTEFLVRRFTGTNPRAKAAMAKYFKPYARQIENDTLSLDKVTEININMFLDVCLVDWKGVVIDGTEVKFDHDTAFKMFRALPDLFDTLWKYANDFKTYREDLGNS